MQFLNRNRKLLSIIALFVFCALHAFFLVRIIYDTKNYLVLGFTSAILLFILISYYKASHDVTPHHFKDLYLVLSVLLGALLTYAIHANTMVSAVLASSGIGLLASYIPYLNKKSTFLNTLPPPIYCGSFVGMSAIYIADSWLFVLYASCIAGIFYMFAKNMLNGFGGKLGSIAFGGVICTQLLYYFIS
ncbi:hypothetical protein GGR32_001990 [Mesonia hippocampi]|uniref:Uncharacterized protein n=1 Tax=Mesonia hippocampi TaxID=1628250 RepID=A0A840F085_9FLAO|nr:hypothetical protein [Mesonia hippocampi]MBB4119684.1 hypothetical protein [Mesonia hippocampi]